MINPLKPKFTIGIFTHYRHCDGNSRLVVDEDDLKWVGNEKNILLLLQQFDEYVRSKTHNFKEIRSFFRDAKFYFNAS